MSGVRALLDDLLGSGGLPEPPPLDPVAALKAWQLDAMQKGCYVEPTAMVLATASRDAVPSARVVLCKSIDDAPPSLVFFTSYTSRKGGELESNPVAAAVFYWPHAGRQARIEGTVSHLAEEASDAYFRTRPLLNRLGAWASEQSRPLASRAALAARMASFGVRFGVGAAIGNSGADGAVPRPPHWGGYRLSIHRIELWASGRGRLHDRIEWRLVADSSTPGSAPRWVMQRLNP